MEPLTHHRPGGYIKLLHLTILPRRRSTSHTHRASFRELLGILTSPDQVPPLLLHLLLPIGLYLEK